MGGIDSYTKLMLHMNSDFSDSSDSGHTPTVSGATIDTTIKKFGAGSGKFVSASSQYVLYPDSLDWYFVIGDFTLDFRIRFTSFTGIVSFVNSFQNSSNYWAAWFDSDLNVLRFANWLSSSYTVHWKVDWSPSLNTWYHIALVRKGTTINDWDFYIEGGALTTGKVLVSGSWGAAVSDFTGNLFIGKHGQNIQYHNGHIDELRISKGIARWTSNFTPPTSEYTSDIVTPDMWQPGIQQPYKEKIEVINYK